MSHFLAVACPNKRERVGASSEAIERAGGKKPNHLLQRFLGCAAAFVLALGCPLALALDLQTQATFNIAPQKLATALVEFSRQANAPVVSATQEVDTFDTQGVSGTLSLKDALEALLNGTNLETKVTESGAIAIGKFGRTADAERLGMRLAQNAGTSGSPDTGTGVDPSLSQAPSGEQNNNGENPQEGPPEDSPEGAVLEEVVVTGTHIRGFGNSTSPVVVLSRSYIESTGLSTTSRLIESLPQNFALTSQAGVLVPGVSSSSEQGSSINLRGIGEGTTLVLLNGRRMAAGFIGSAVDISALPLSAIERVEVLTDGASAIYGSDAIGGVVNFILRNDFEGAETQVRGGWADGVDEYRVTQGLGTAWDSGNALVSLEYYRRDLLRANERDFVPSTSGVGSLYPDDENYSGMVSARQRLAGNLSLFADALFVRRDSYNEAGRISVNENIDTRNPQSTATVGLDWGVGGDWELEVSGSYARNELDQVQRRSDDDDFVVDTTFEIKAAQVKADGGLWDLPGGKIRGAIGFDWRSEVLSARSGRPAVPDGMSAMEWDQVVRSAFAELRVPIVGADNAVRAASRLELSVAGRFDDYSNFGSSFDPQVGLMWEPIRGFRLRATHGTSYKAPKLTDYDLRFNSAIALFLPDPAAPSGISHQLWITGADTANYSPQESESWSFGVEFSRSLTGLKAGLNYYEIEYRNRIADPPSADIVIANPASFGELILRDPSVAQVNDYIALGDLGQGLTTLDPDFNIPNPNFTPDSVEIILDVRRRNLSALKTSGLDATIGYVFDAGNSTFELGANGTYIFELDQRATKTSEPFDTVDTVFNPPRLRLRANAGWRSQGWGATMFLNYTGSYEDNRDATPVAVSSYTTLDAQIAYSFGEGVSDGFWSDVGISLSVQNMLDEDPPRTAVLADFRDMGFDPTNGNPMGRLIALQLSKSW